MNDDDVARLSEHTTQLASLSAELDRQRQSFTSRQSAMYSRAAILVGSASIASGIQSAGHSDPWAALGVFASLLAALLGVVALWVRTGPEPDMGKFRDKLYELAPGAMELTLFDAKLDAHGLDEASLTRRRRLVNLGFTALSLAILFVGLHAAGVTIRFNFH
jgi:hypothetical protein